LRCETLIDLDDEQLNQSVDLPSVAAGAFEIEEFSIHFHGICAACRRKPRSSKPVTATGTKKTSRTAKSTRKKAKKTRT
ncbi:hypothetical protein KQH29_01135, partial [bacterium]|nr:hypothetical protein [bacterium]